MRIDIPWDPGIDPTFGGYRQAAFDHAICANLVGFPDRPNASRIVGDVAALPRITNRGKRYTFRIRNDARFWTGARVRPQDVKATIQRFLTINDDGALLSGIEGADAFRTGHARSVRGVLAHGNLVVIELTKRDNALLAKLTDPALCILSSRTPTDPNNPLVTPPVTAGPYRVSKYVPGKQIVLGRNPHYHGARPHHLSRFVINTALTADEDLRRVESGQADLTFDVDPASGGRLASKYGVNKGRFRVDPYPGTQYIPLNTSRAPFKSLAVRRAVNYAVGRVTLIHGLTGLNTFLWNKPTNQVLPPGTPGYRRLDIYPLTRPNYPRARAILKRAHARCGDVTLYAFDDPLGHSRQEATVLKRQWAHIGCHVIVEPIKPSAFWTRIGHRGEPFDAAIGGPMGWQMDYLDPSNFFQLFDGRTLMAENNVNYSYLNVPEVNRQIAAADRLRGSNRIRAYQRLDRLITATQAPWVAVSTYRYLTLLSDRVHGYFAQPFCSNPDIGVAVDLVALRLRGKAGVSRM